MRPDEVERAVDALISRVPVPAGDGASIIARGHERLVRRRIVLSGVSFAVLATIATAGAVANSHHTTTVGDRRPAPTISPGPSASTTTTTLPADAGPQFVQIKAVSALEAWKCLDPLQYTDDGGRTWREITAPPGATSIGNPTLCAAVAGGNAWAVQETTDDPRRPDVLRVRRGFETEVIPFPRLLADARLDWPTFVDASHGWALAIYGGTRLEDLYRTLDGGRTWTVVAENQPLGYGHVFTSATRGWARNGDQVFTTLDGGATWRAVVLPAALHIAGFKLDVYDIAAQGRSVVVYRRNRSSRFAEPVFDVSTDGGRTWSQRPGPELPANADSQFEAADALHWRLFSGQVLWISDDGGRSWAPRPKPPVATYVESMSFPTADVGWISGRSTRSAIVLRTTDAGRTWTDVTNGRPPPGGIIGCPTQPLTPAPAGDPPPGVVSAAIADEHARANRTGGTVTAVYRVGYVGAGAFGNTFRDNVTSCGPAVARASWVVEFGDTAVVLAHYADGWHVFGRKQPFTS